MQRCLSVFLLLVCGVATADEVKLSPRHVSVTGTAVARVQPDTVVWRIDVRRANKELGKAQAECDEGVKKILALRTQLKLKPEEVQTGFLSVQKIYDRDQAGNQTSFRHFLVERSVTLRQRDTSRVDEVLAQLVATADVEASYSLESSAYRELRAQTRLEAVKAARQKSAAMTELLGAKLGRVLRIAEPIETWAAALLYANNAVSAAPRQAETDEVPGTFAPGTIEVKVSIDVTFEIE
jgi:uncharacterized protein YggE